MILRPLAVLAAIFFMSDMVQAARDFDWSSKAACQQLFLGLNDSQVESATYQMLTSSSSPNALTVLKGDAWRTPMVLMFAGPSQSEKTSALTQSLFPLLRRQGYSSLRIPTTDLIALYKKSEVLPTFEAFDIVAIDDLDLASMGYERYNAISLFVRERFLRGQSTVLVLKNHPLIVVNEEGRLDTVHEQLMDFVVHSTKRGQTDIYSVNFDLGEARSTRH